MPKQRQQTETFVIEIQSWGWDFSFAMSTLRPGEFQDFRHLLFKGILLRPERYSVKAVELTLMPSADIVDRHTTVGTVGRRIGILTPLVWIPESSLTQLLTVAERLRYAILTVAPDPESSHPDILGVSLRMSLDDDDLQ